MTKKTDLVERLRLDALEESADYRNGREETTEILREAADEIERLEKALLESELEAWHDLIEPEVRRITGQSDPTPSESPPNP